MKLRNLLYATMIACAFASCSNDDDPINNIDGETPVGKNEAVLVVNMAGVQSKANIATTNENAINLNTTQVVVFNGTGNAAVVEAVGKVNQNANKTEKIALTPGNKMVLVLANYKDAVAVGTKYSDLKAKTIDFASYEGVDGYLTMNSQLYTVSLAAGKVNYLGYAVPGTVPTTENYLNNTAGNPVYLYHNVAKVTLNSIAVNTKAGAAATQYPNPKLDVKEVFILHAHKNSKLFTENAWGVTNVTDDYLNAHSDTDYAAWVTKMHSYTPIFSYLTDNYAKGGYDSETFTGISLGYNSNINAEENTIEQGGALAAWNTNNNKSFYTYENTDIDADGFYTLLVVKGDFSYDGYENEMAVRKTDVDRYYSVAVGVTGYDKNGYAIPGSIEGLDASLRTPNFNGAYKGVIRNLQYRIGMTITGPGYTTPFGPDGGTDTFLAVNVQVVDFGNVDQDASFE